jgi:hypothetical protein
VPGTHSFLRAALLETRQGFQRVRHQKLHLFSSRPAVRPGGKELKARRKEFKAEAQGNQNPAQGNESPAQGNENSQYRLFNGLRPAPMLERRLTLPFCGSRQLKGGLGPVMTAQ